MHDLSHPAILVAPAEPRQFDHEDFEDLVFRLFDETGIKPDEIQIRVGYLYGNGVTEWTAVNFILDEAGRTAIGAVVTAVLAWGRRWWKRHKDEPQARPIKAFLYGPDGNILREVEVRPEDDESV